MDSFSEHQAPTSCCVGRHFFLFSLVLHFSISTEYQNKDFLQQGDPEKPPPAILMDYLGCTSQIQTCDKMLGGEVWVHLYICLKAVLMVGRTHCVVYSTPLFLL